LLRVTGQRIAFSNAILWRPAASVAARPGAIGLLDLGPLHLGRRVRGGILLRLLLRHLRRNFLRAPPGTVEAVRHRRWRCGLVAARDGHHNHGDHDRGGFDFMVETPFDYESGWLAHPFAA
jgi:hypothetical protein